jgi:hypothetical protein
MNAQDIAKKLFEEIKEIEEVFKSECAIWKKHNLSCKLIILGEAPLSSNQFFYKAPGSYLSFLKNHYPNWNAKGSGPQDFLDFLRNKGILNLDIYKFPLPTTFYDSDKNLYLFDGQYLTKKINDLTKLGIINSQTCYIYRYQKLLYRNLQLQEPLKSIPCHIPLPIAIKANASVINPAIIKYLP